MLISRIGTSLEFEAPLDLQAHMPREIPDVPQVVGLTVEYRNDDRSRRSKQRQRGFEKLDEEFL